MEGAKTLTQLHISNANITAAGIASLQKALPNCQIEWDGAAPVGTLAPPAAKTPRVAEWTIKLGGSVFVKGRADV